jgi:uncharacterized protein (TIGR02145 family)
MNRKQHFIWVSLFFTFFLIQVTLEAQEPVILDSKMKPGISNDMRIEELKVRWKKAALENCPGVPCVTTPPAPSFTCGTSTVTDIDGNSYNTVLIGTQCWTKENLKVTKYNDGSPITPDATGTSTGSGIGEMWSTRNSGAYTIYEHNNSNVTTYGLLYNWFAATDAKKLCPDGWHVPSDVEWTNLILHLDGNAIISNYTQSLIAGGMLKSTSNLWNVATTPSPGTNSSGFTGIPGGFRSSAGAFVQKGDNAYFWSTTTYPTSAFSAYFKDLNYSNNSFDRDWLNKTVGMSIRCIKN